MSENCTKRDTCRLCGSKNLKLALPMKGSAIADAFVSESELHVKQEVFPLDLYLCEDCAHVQLIDVVDPNTLFSDYIYETSMSLGLVAHFKEYATSLISKFGFATDELVVEIGSNDGTHLGFYRDHGMRVLGIDPARRIAAEATERGINTLPEFFTSNLAKNIRETHGAATLVTANNVYAHADNLSDITYGIRELLAPEGIFVFEVSYLDDIVKCYLFDTIYHEHVCYHSIRPFQKFFDTHGLELFDVERIGSKGGSIRGFVQLKGGSRTVSSSVSELIDLEVKEEYHKPETFLRYAERIADKRAQLQELLKKYKDQGKVIVGYGASHTVNTLLYEFELDEYLDYLLDDNERKQGLYSPGQHLEVRPSTNIYEQLPDIIVVLAWNYAEPIMKRHQEFLSKGGSFVIPLPEMKIITHFPESQS